VDGFALTVGTNVTLEDTVLRAPENQSSAISPEPCYALDLSTASIRGDLQLQPNIRLEGGLKMRDAHVGGSVWAQGLHATDGETAESRSRIAARRETTRSAFRLEGSHIEGRVALGHLEPFDPLLNRPFPSRFWCEGRVDLNWVRIDSSLELSGAFVGNTPDAALSLYTARLGELFALPVIPPVNQEEHAARFALDTGTLQLGGCRISGKCALEFPTLDARKQIRPIRFLAQGLSVSGNLTLKGAISHLEAPGLEVTGDTVLVLQDVETCNLGGAALKGKLDLADVLFRSQFPSPADAQPATGPAAEWRPEGATRYPLVCYPGMSLTRLTFSSPHSSALWETAFLHGSGRVVPLTGKAEEIHTLNHAIALHLSSELAAEEYLKFFCAYVWSPQGPFAVIEDAAALPAAFRHRISQEELGIKKGARTDSEASFTFDCLLRYAGVLYRASFAVATSGETTMNDSTPMILDGAPVTYSPAEIPGYKSGLRYKSVTAVIAVPDFHGASQPSSGEESLRQFLADVPEWKFQLARSVHKIAPSETLLSLRDADIGHMLVVSPLFQIESAKRWQLQCYPGFVLYEVVLRADGSYAPSRTASFLSDGKTSYLLNGDAAVFHNLNALGRLQLSGAMQAVEYLRLFTSYTWAESAFTLIESISDLPVAFKPRLWVQPVTLNEGKSDPANRYYVFDAFVRYGFYLFKARFEVPADGGVQMIEDEGIVHEGGEPVVYHPGEVTEYRKPFRLLTTSPTFADFSSPAETPIEPSEFVRGVPDWNQRLMAGRLTGVRVDLRDTSCATLNDNAGLIWRDAAAIDLEEFTYRTLFLPPNTGIDLERKARLRWLSGSTVDEQSLRARMRRVRQVFGIAGNRDERPFRAQPYTQLAKAFRERGDDEAARDVEKEKVRLAAYARASSPGGRLAMLWWWFYGLGFRYGLSPTRAFLTVVVFWIVGFAGIEFLDQNDLLKTNVSTFAVATIAQPNGDVVPYLQPAPNGPVPKLSCGDSIDPKLYAAELLIPLLNLHQANRCDIRDEQPYDAVKSALKFGSRAVPVPHLLVLPRTWQYIRAIYIILGSIATSIALLTFSGVARRWER
jgi:hypothetical protein